MPCSKPSVALVLEAWQRGGVDDTSPEAIRRYSELLRRLEPGQRLELASKLIQATRELAIAGLRRAAVPRELTPAELRRGLAERLYGRELSERFFRPG